MTPDRWSEIEALFHAAHELPPPDRAAWLDRHAPDPDLRAEVESLLDSAADEPVTSVREAIGAAAARSLETAADPAGRRIGPYRIVRLLGQGGMGAVFLAERDGGEFHQQVAIKILRAGFDAPAAIDRFRQERRILARLEHPHIARLLDGGATPDGLPYIAMEYVEGRPLLAWTRESHASVPDRLRLFREICDAVQYAHRNLIVHRDLKSSNILVTPGGAAKLLDFGIAKLLEGPDAAETVTALRAFTPNYASPEQITGGAVTTATDVYSLGVILFELLTGRLPYNLDSGTSGYAVERAIVESEPPRPSSAAPARDFREDLDYIVLKALRKEPSARYVSVEQFSADIANYLAGRPVVARGGAVAYRATRFVARHRWAMSAAAVVVLSIGGGVAGTIHQRRRAERRFEQVRSLANTFLFQVHDGIADLPGATPVRELLVKTALQYLDSLAPEARGDAGLQFELANAYNRVGIIQSSGSYANLGQLRQAIASWDKAVAIYRDLERSPLSRQASRGEASALLELGINRHQLGEFAAAARDFETALAIAERLRAKADDWPSLLLVTSARNRRGDLNMRTGHAAKALDDYRPVLSDFEKMMARQPERRLDSAFATCYLRLGDALHATGDPAAAFDAYRRADEIVRAHGPDSAHSEDISRLLGVAAANRGDALGGLPPHLGAPAAALSAYRDAIRHTSDLYRADPKNARVANDLAIGYARAIPSAPPDVAAAYGRELLAIAGRLLEQTPDSVEFLQRKLAALWGLARGAAGSDRLARRRDAEALDRDLRRRAPGDAEVLRLSLRMRLDFAADPASLTAIAADAAAAPPDAFLRDIAARAYAGLAAAGDCQSAAKAREIWSGWSIPYAKRMIAALPSAACGTSPP